MDERGETLGPTDMGRTDPGAPGAWLRPVAPERYTPQGLIGSGGMGTVHRLYDRELRRMVAMKTLHPDLAARPAAVARFMAEAQSMAQLQHPSIVPVYEIGKLKDGTPFFTMEEVRGRTLRPLLRQHHGGEAEPELPLRRLIDAFRQVCRAVAFAHGRGVLHRDLKPENVLVGDHGEVFVLDWGIARELDLPESTEDRVETILGEDPAFQTREGTGIGTPAYMAPEQLAGRRAAMGPWTDVYGLGAMLYEILSGRPPFSGDMRPRLLGALPREPFEPGSRPGLEALVEAAMAALAADPTRRTQSAGELADAVERWLDGQDRTGRARRIVQDAFGLKVQLADLRTLVEAKRREGEALLEAVPAWASEDRKLPAWTLLDEATALSLRCARLEAERQARLQAALLQAPELAEAHAALAEDWRAQQAVSEERRDPSAAAAAEVRLRHHLDALPAADPARPALERWLRAEGALTLHTDPPGAEVWLERYELRGRRLVAVPDRRVGHTPLDEVPLPSGSWRLRLRLAGHAEVLYPVHLPRQHHWDGVPPGATRPASVWLPPEGALGAGEVYIPAGWFLSGGDPDARCGPSRRLWCEGFLLDRFPVTVREYLAFLNDLVLRGRDEEVGRLLPCLHTASVTEAGAPVFARGADGLYRPKEEPEMSFHADDPMALLDLGCALALAAWRKARDGGAWGLPAELAWEKAARGVDGRLFPWGDHLDPSFCRMANSHEGTPRWGPVDSFPVDESPYGVRGMAGGVRSWTGDVFLLSGPAVTGERVEQAIVETPPPAELQSTRGGCWFGPDRYSHSANREPDWPGFRDGSTGVRLGRGLPRKG